MAIALLASQRFWMYSALHPSSSALSCCFLASLLCFIRCWTSSFHHHVSLFCLLLPDVVPSTSLAVSLTRSLIRFQFSSTLSLPYGLHPTLSKRFPVCFFHVAATILSLAHVALSSKPLFYRQQLCKKERISSKSATKRYIPQSPRSSVIFISQRWNATSDEIWGPFPWGVRIVLFWYLNHQVRPWVIENHAS